eukprot:s2622_g1.t1
MGISNSWNSPRRCAKAYQCGGGTDEPVWCLDWSPFGQYFLTGTDGETALWSVEHACVLRVLGSQLPRPSPVRALRVHPNGRLAAVATHERVVLWDLASAAPAQELPLKHCTALAFSPDGSILACGSSNMEESEIEIASCCGSWRPTEHQATSMEELSVPGSQKTAAGADRNKAFLCSGVADELRMMELSVCSHNHTACSRDTERNRRSGRGHLPNAKFFAWNGGRSGSFTSALLGGGSGQDPLHFCEIKAGRFGAEIPSPFGVQRVPHGSPIKKIRIPLEQPPAGYNIFNVQAFRSDGGPASDERAFEIVMPGEASPGPPAITTSVAQLLPPVAMLHVMPCIGRSMGATVSMLRALRDAWTSNVAGDRLDILVAVAPPREHQGYGGQDRLAGTVTGTR